MSNSSEVKAKRKVGSPINRSSGWDRTAPCMRAEVSKIRLAYSRYPSRPIETSEAQVAASSPSDREPSIPGEKYVPPRQSGMKKQQRLRSSRSRKSKVEVPLSP